LEAILSPGPSNGANQDHNTSREHSRGAEADAPKRKTQPDHGHQQKANPLNVGEHGGPQIASKLLERGNEWRPRIYLDGRLSGKGFLPG